MHFDIVIVGGGLVGASLASVLKDQNLKVALIDNGLNRPLKELRDDRDEQLFLIEKENNSENTFLNARALALSPTTVQTLKKMQLWSKLESFAEPLREVHASKKGCFGVTRIRAIEHQLPALGYVVNADVLNHILNQGLEDIQNLTIFCPGEIRSLKKIENNNDFFWSVDLNSHQTITGSLLIAADGSESYLRKHQGLDAKIMDYKQTAMVVNIELMQSHQGIAYERFLENGSLALLPFGENRVKCVWVMPTNEISLFKALSDEECLDKIQTHFGYQCGRFQKIGQRIFYPLRSIQAEALYGDRLVLVGNAANTLHPVAAQGFNLGLRDVATLAELLVSASLANQDIGSVELFQSYSQSRQIDHLAVRRFTDGLANPTIMHWLGILASEWIPPFKQWVANQGIGTRLKIYEYE